ncbi:MAG: MBL fold metallo-hydrolase [Dehalococcoidia bacterium]
MGGLQVLTFRHGPFWNFSYLLACSETGTAAVIDPAWDLERILKAAAARGLTITTALLTHGHSDHVNRVPELVAATGAAVAGHGDEIEQLESQVGPRIILSGGEWLGLGAHEIEVIHTPGHSDGSLSFLVAGRLFCGDTLNVGSVGRPGPDRASVEALWESIRRLRELPGDTVIHPGHDDGPGQWSTVGEELARVAAWRAETLEAFVSELERTTGRSHRHDAV